VNYVHMYEKPPKNDGSHKPRQIKIIIFITLRVYAYIGLKLSNARYHSFTFVHVTRERYPEIWPCYKARVMLERMGVL
jgi:hypothetical protein